MSVDSDKKEILTKKKLFWSDLDFEIKKLIELVSVYALKISRVCQYVLQNSVAAKCRQPVRSASSASTLGIDEISALVAVSTGSDVDGESTFELAAGFITRRGAACLETVVSGLIILRCTILLIYELEKGVCSFEYRQNLTWVDFLFESI